MADLKPDKNQVDKFRDAARELETDNREEAFNLTLRKIALATKPPEPSRDNHDN